MALKRTAAVTGAFSYSGQYIARSLLKRGWEVITLTRDPQRPHELRDKIKAFPLDFLRPDQLKSALSGVDALLNTYWVRFNYPGSSFVQAVENNRLLFEAASAAGVRRLIHISVSNPDIKSDLEYYRGKAEVENMIIDSTWSYAILRPTLIFGREEVLVNNIAWLLRNLPLFFIPGNGEYRLQPVSAEDLGELAAAAAQSSSNQVLPAAGPETYTFAGLVRFLKELVGSRALLVHAPPSIALLAAKLVGLMLRDITLNRAELQGLLEERLYLGEPALGKTRFSDWAKENKNLLGARYMHELKRHHGQ